MRHTEVALARLVAQRIAGPGCASPAEAVTWMTAVQAQDHRAALSAVALRAGAPRCADVEAALSAGAVVRSWPMRGTLHLVAAVDLGWMLALTGPRQIASARGRQAQLGLTADHLEAARESAVAALGGGRHLSREQLLGVWAARGLDTAAGRGSHLLRHLAQSGLLCWGPVHEGTSHAVLVDEWVTTPRRLSREEALGEWARRYFASHGPATLADFARWTHLTMADVRTGVALARGELERIDVDGIEHLMDPSTLQRLAAHRDHARGVFLLPAFDEMVLGYADRSATVPPEFADRIVPGGNGMFLPTVIDDGRAVATWRRRTGGSAAVGAVEVQPFTTLRPQTSAAVPALAEALPVR